MAIRCSLAVGIIAIALSPACSSGQLKRGDFELTLSAAGFTPIRDKGLEAAVSAGLGVFLTDNIELGVRQQFIYDDLDVAASFNGATLFAADWNLTIASRWQPFVGAFVGYQYGDLVSASAQAGPEAGLRYFVTPDAFVYLLTDYRFLISGNGNSQDDDELTFSIGIGARF
jgi:hypothetical protein